MLQMMASAALGPNFPSESELDASAFSSTTGPKEEQQTDELQLGLPPHSSDVPKAVVVQVTHTCGPCRCKRPLQDGVAA